VRNFISFKAMRQIERNRTQILGVLKKLGIKVGSNPDPVLVRKAVAAGLMTNLAKRASLRGFNYQWQDDSEVFVHPGSSCFGGNPPDLMVCAEIVATTKTFARGCTEIEPAWVVELVPADQLVYRLEIHTSMFGSGLPTLYQDIQYQNISLGRQVVDKIPAQGLPYIAANLAEKIDRQTGGWVSSSDSSWHPGVDRVRMTWSRIKAALGIIGQHDPEMRQRLVEDLVEQLQGCETLQDVIERELKIKISDYVSGERLAEIAAEQAEYEREQEEHERKLEQRRIKDRERRARHEAERQERIRQREKLLAPTVELLAELRDRVSYLHEDRIGLYRRISDQENSITLSSRDPDDIKRSVDWIATTVRQAERDSGRLAMSEKIHDAILFQFPVCPLCGANWKPVDWVMSFDSVNLVCRNSEQHDLRRLLPLHGHVTPRQIGKLVTDKGELAGTVLADDHGIQISLPQARNRAWCNTKFDQVVYQPAVSILPPELAEDRDQILQDLYDLALLKAKAKDLVNQIKQTEEELGSGQVIRLTFKSDPTSGRPFAKVHGSTYSVGYDDKWPESGETWLCRVGGSTGMQTNVTTLFKIESLPEELAELRELVEESYPGLPTELLPNKNGMH
jgi:hypothetical protein